MAKKAKSPSPFEGRWRITSMEMWSQGVVDAEVEGFVEFGPNGLGSFQFAYVSGDIDYRDSTKDGKPSVEWSWDGNDEMDAAKGSGWAVLKDDELHGMIFFHEGDYSAFMAKRAERKKSKKTKPEDTGNSDKAVQELFRVVEGVVLSCVASVAEGTKGKEAMPNSNDNSNKAFLGLVRILEDAVRAGADSIGLEYKGRDLVVFFNFGNTGLVGVGAARIPQALQEDVIREIVERAGLSRKSKGNFQVQLLGKDYEVNVKEYDSFGESAFTITLKELKKKAQPRK